MNPNMKHSAIIGGGVGALAKYYNNDNWAKYGVGSAIASYLYMRMYGHKLPFKQPVNDEPNLDDDPVDNHNNHTAPSNSLDDGENAWADQYAWATL